MNAGGETASRSRPAMPGPVAEAVIWQSVNRMSKVDGLDDALQLLMEAGASAGFGRPAFAEDVVDNRCATGGDGRRLLEHVGWPAGLMDQLADLPFTHRHPMYTICQSRDGPFAIDERDSWRIWTRLASEQRLLREAMLEMHVEAFACIPLHRSRGRVAALVWAADNSEKCSESIKRYGPALQALANQFIDRLDRVNSTKNPEPMPLLTTRQIDCLYHAAQGATAEETATSLGLSPYTVRQYLKEACDRLGARNVSHAVAIACCNGTISEIGPRARHQG